MTNEQLREARAKLGATQAELAIALGVSIPTIQNWERGTHRIPKPAALLVKGWDRWGYIPSKDWLS